MAKGLTYPTLCSPPPQPLPPAGGSVFTSVSFYMPWIRAGVDFLRRGVTSRGACLAAARWGCLTGAESRRATETWE